MKRIHNFLTKEKKRKSLMSDKLINTNQLSSQLSSNLSNILFWENSSDTKGLLLYKKLNFDSSIFGMKMINIKEILSSDKNNRMISKELLNLLDNKEAIRGENYFTIRLPSKNIKLINILEENGYSFIEVLQTFLLNLENIGDKRDITNVRMYSKEDLPRILDIGSSLFVNNRFHLDPYLNNSKCDLLYESWIKNDCTGRSDFVFVLEEAEKVIGFLTCNILESENGDGQRGIIDLIAVDSNYRSKNVASRLTNYMIDCLIDKGINIVEVGTQIHNIPAINFYHKFGFRYISSQVTMRKFTIVDR